MNTGASKKEMTKEFYSCGKENQELLYIRARYQFQAINFMLSH